MINREIFKTIQRRLDEKRAFIQVLSGPRQVGKSVLAQQLIKDHVGPHHYATTDSPTPRDANWIEQQWEIGRLLWRQAGGAQSVLLVFDEIQKITGWSESVKLCWDEDSATNTDIKVLLLGSSPLLIQKGLTESLAGRFELTPVTHWSYQEMHNAFGYSVEEYIFFGGYPAAAPLRNDALRWENYLNDSLIETTISRDILLLTRVDKPALLRKLFRLGCDYSGQVLSFQKMLGQLHEAGNASTLAHYLDLLSGVGLLTGLEKFSDNTIRQRASSPKLQVLTTALMSANARVTFQEAEKDRNFWGRLVESAVGAHLVNSAKGKGIEVFYWREGNKEVDFIITRGPHSAAFEVKSGLQPTALPGMTAFKEKFPSTSCYLIGGSGVSFEKFFLTGIEEWLGVG